MTVVQTARSLQTLMYKKTNLYALRRICVSYFKVLIDRVRGDIQSALVQLTRMRLFVGIATVATHRQSQNFLSADQLETHWKTGIWPAHGSF